MVAVCHAERADHRHRDCGRGSGQAVRGDAELLRGYADRNGGIPAQSVTATLGTKQYTGTCGSNGKCALTVNYAGTYSVTATKSGVSSSMASAAVSTSGGSYTATVKFLHPHRHHRQRLYGQGGQRLHHAHGHQQRNGKVLPAEHRHVERHCHQERRDGHRRVACSSYTGYTLELSYVKVFGVCWNYSAQSTALTRLKKATDPNGWSMSTSPRSRACGRYRRRQLLPSTTISRGAAWTSTTSSTMP